MPPNGQQLSPQAMRDHFSNAISHIFQQVQLNTANHRKNYVTLYKVHVEAAGYTEETPRGTKIVGEKHFREVFWSYLLRILPIKKANSAADRTLKFVGGYIKFMNEKAIEERANQDDDEDDNTTASRFTVFLLNELQKGFVAKDKHVRYRVVYTLLEMIAHLGQIDEDIYDALREALVGRIRDKEASIRSAAAICLAKLASSEDPSEIDEEGSVQSILLGVMAYDPSPEVRRATVMNISLNSRTLPAVLERTRDEDENIRKLIYGSILSNHMSEGEEAMLGPTHPKTLSIAQREMIVKNGLGDRDKTVQSAAGLLISKWVDIIIARSETPDIKIEDTPLGNDEDKLLTLLALFDLNADITVAINALESVFKTKSEIFKNIKFDDTFWANLTPEKALLARVFVYYCKSIKEEAKIEDTLPVVTAIAFRIQDQYNQYVGFRAGYDSFITLKDTDETDSGKWEDEKTSREFILSELLKLAVNLDYSDEIGRRKSFQLVRDMLGAELLPEVLMGPCLDVLRELSVDEHDLIRLAVETVQELRDTVIESEEVETQPEQDPDQSLDMEDNPRPLQPSVLNLTLTPEQSARLDVVDSKCLTMCIAMLERVDSTFDENSSLEGALQTLIIPAAQRPDGILQEKGIKALGLCCLIARRLAVQSFKKFISMLSSSAPSNIRLISAHSLIDIIMVHKEIIFRDGTNNLEMVTMFLLNQIRKEQDPEVQAVLCHGTAKLIRSGMITDIEAVKTLLKAYISPLTASNDGLRQVLTLFFEVYSLHTSLQNQQNMREIFMLVFLDVCEDRRLASEIDEDIDVVESNQIADMFVGWTNPLRLSKAIMDARDDKRPNECIQLDMAKDIITLLFEKDLKIEIEKQDKRVLCQLLNKLYVPDTVDDYRIRSMKLLMVNLRTRRPLRDTVSKTAFAKFESAITQKFEKQLEHFSEEEFRKLEELQELFTFLDDIIPLDEEELIDVDFRKRSRKRRSESFVSTGSEGRSGSPARRVKGKSMPKRPRLSADDNNDDDDDDKSTQRGTPNPPSAPTRTLPKRAAASRKPPQVIVISSDDDESYGEGSSNGSGRQGTRARYRPSVKEEIEEAQIDDEIDDLLEGNSSVQSEVPYDSIMGPDSEEEEDEVNDLLAED